VAPQSRTRKAGEALRKFALAYPETREDFPWGERALKVQAKIFVFMHYDVSHLSLSLKLPTSHGAAVMLPFAEPTGYGLWKSGWVTARFGRGTKPPLRLLRAWVDESYRAIAPRRLTAALRSSAVLSSRAHPRRPSRRVGARS
jgi:predicted DNA-binding protein (MmcQ/YjbR family)